MSWVIIVTSPPSHLNYLQGLSATSSLGHSLLCLSSHAGQCCLEKKINIKCQSKVLYSQPRSLSQNKKGEIYLLWVMGIKELGTFHWQGNLAKIVLVDFKFIWLILSPLVKRNYFCLGNKTSCFLCHFSSESYRHLWQTHITANCYDVCCQIHLFIQLL